MELRAPSGVIMTVIVTVSQSPRARGQSIHSTAARKPPLQQSREKKKGVDSVGVGGREKKGWTGTSKQAFGVVCFHAGPLNQRIIEK